MIAQIVLHIKYETNIYPRLWRRRW